MLNIYDKIIELQQSNTAAAICTIVNTKGSTPRKVGAKMIVQENEKVFGTIGGGAFEKNVIAQAIIVMNEGKAKIFRHHLLQEHNMCCGGTVEVFIEPVMKKNKLYIFGAGHVGKALCRYASDFNFDITVIDDREEHLNEVQPDDVQTLLMSHNDALEALTYDEKTFICIMTYSHPVDKEILTYCLRQPFAYVGMIGSQRKVEVTKKMLAEVMHFSEEEIVKADMPMGLDIDAESPEEIAISILSKLIKVKNKVNA